MDCMKYHELPAFFQGAADIFAEKKEELCEMDANMGDGDLGLTMEKGFGALPQLIRENGEEGNSWTDLSGGLNAAANAGQATGPFWTPWMRLLRMHGRPAGMGQIWPG